MDQSDRQPRFVLNAHDSAKLAEILRTVPPRPWPRQRRRFGWSLGLLVALLLVGAGLFLTAQIYPDIAEALGKDLPALAQIVGERSRALAEALASAAGAAIDAATGWLAGRLSH